MVEQLRIDPINPCAICGTTDPLSHTCRPPAVRTISGRLVDITNPKPGDFDIVDIAHALSLQCRYNGHVTRMYTVAAHSLLVERILEIRRQPPLTRLRGLLHDATEAYMSDIAAPQKKWTLWGQAYARAEAVLMEHIWSQFGFEPMHPAGLREVAEADHWALVWEVQSLELKLSEGKEKLPNLIERELTGWGGWDSPLGLAGHQFVDRYTELRAKL